VTQMNAKPAAKGTGHHAQRITPKSVPALTRPYHKDCDAGDGRIVVSGNL